MNNQDLIEITKIYVQKILNNDTAHDWWHVHRVWQIAALIAQEEKANSFIIEMAALLHDLEDWKFETIHQQNKGLVSQWLKERALDAESQNHILNIIENMSFQGANVPSKILTLEGKIVQDADRLDAMGAIGIARTFSYGGYKNREIHNPNILPILHNNFSEYKAHQGTTINHFYEKLLLLKDQMNTPTGKRIAAQRHQFMLNFLEEFFKEWNN